MNIHTIGGQHFYYLASCKRQLWLYINKFEPEENFESLELGRLLHEESFGRKKKEIRIAGMKIDFISKDGYIHETKSSKQIKKEHEMQPLFYVYYFHFILGFDHIKGAKIHYPSIKKVITLELDKERIDRVERSIEEIIKVSRQKDVPPVHTNLRLCRKCAYFEFCYV